MWGRDGKSSLQFDQVFAPVVLGVAARDNLLFSKRFATAAESGGSDQLTLVESAVTCLGGKGLVFARSLVSLGGEPHLVTLIDRGAAIEGLVEGALTLASCPPWLSEPHEIWTVMSPAGQGTSAFVRLEDGAVHEAAYVSQFRKALLGSAFVYITYDQPALLRGALGPLREAAARGLRVALNLCAPLTLRCADDDPDLLIELVLSADLLILNRDESDLALEMLKLDGWGSLESERLGEIVITDSVMGGRFALSPFDNWTSYAAVSADGVNCVVGAGDTFNAAYLLSRWGRGLDALSACAFAAEVAGAKVKLRRSWY